MNTTTNQAGLMNTPASARSHLENPAPTGGTYDIEGFIAAIPNAVDVALKKAIPAEYTPEKVAAIAADLATRIRAQYGPCTIWPAVCTRTGAHDDHINDDMSITSQDGERLLDVTFTQFSDTEGVSPARIAISGYGSEEYAPEDVHAATARIRDLCDEADNLADKVLNTLAGGAR